MIIFCATEKSSAAASPIMMRKYVFNIKQLCYAMIYIYMYVCIKILRNNYLDSLSCELLNYSMIVK